MCLGNVGTHPPATGLSKKDQDIQTLGHLHSSTTYGKPLKPEKSVSHFLETIIKIIFQSRKYGCF